MAELPTTKDIRIIAIDMDGTLLSTQKTISEENKYALQKASQAGVQIVLASGRMSNLLHEYAEELEIDCILMGYNGAECLHTREQSRKQLFHFPLPTEASNELMEFCRDNNYFLNVYLNGLLHGVDDMALRHLPDGYNYLNRGKYTFVPDYQQLLDTAPTKALIIARSLEEREKLHLDLYSKFGPEGHNLHIVRTLSYNDHLRQDYLEFLRPGVNKGNGLQSLCAALDLSLEQVVAFGDADNDIEMLRMAGRGICMAQGTEEAKSAASSHVSAYTNDENAVAREINALLFA